MVGLDEGLAFVRQQLQSMAIAKKEVASTVLATEESLAALIDHARPAPARNGDRAERHRPVHDILLDLPALGSASGIPSSALVCLSVLLVQMGIPVEAVSLIMGIDPFSACFVPCRTTPATWLLRLWCPRARGYSTRRYTTAKGTRTLAVRSIWLADHLSSRQSDEYRAAPAHSANEGEHVGTFSVPS